MHEAFFQKLFVVAKFMPIESDYGKQSLNQMMN